MSAARRRRRRSRLAGVNEILLAADFARTTAPDGRMRGRADGRRKSNNRQFCFCAGRNLPEHDRSPPARSSRRERRADGFLAPSPDVRGRNLSDARLSTAATDIFARITATARRRAPPFLPLSIPLTDNSFLRSPRLRSSRVRASVLSFTLRFRREENRKGRSLFDRGLAGGLMRILNE